MKKLITSKVPFILLMLGIVVLNVVFWPVLLANGIEHSKTTLWIGYGFLMGAFAICCSLTFIKPANKVISISTLPIFLVSFSYLIINIVFNVTLMFINYDTYLWGLIVNIVVLVLYAAILLMCYKHYSRVSDNVKRREARVKDWRLIGAKINNIISISIDQEITKELRNLYDDVKYSSSASNENTQELEEKLESQIAIIESLIESKSDNITILNAIKKARNILKSRNQILIIK